MAFDKEAQRLKAAQMSAGGAVAPRQIKPVPKPTPPTPVNMMHKDFLGNVLKVGDSVIHPTANDRRVYLTKRTITKIDGEKLFLDNSHVSIRNIRGLIKV